MGTMRALGMEENTDPILSEMSIVYLWRLMVHLLAFPELSDKASLLCVTNPPNIRHVA